MQWNEMKLCLMQLYLTQGVFCFTMDSAPDPSIRGWPEGESEAAVDNAAVEL